MTDHDLKEEKESNETDTINSVATKESEADTWDSVAGIKLPGKLWLIGAAVLAAVFALGPWFGNNYSLQILFTMIMWIGLATSWNILGGYTGYISFGHAAFFALGAFVVGLGQQYFQVGQVFGVGLIAILLLAGIVPAVVATIIAYPLLRLRSGYFSIALLGLQLALAEAFNTFDILGGGTGISVSLNQTPLSTNMILYYILAFVVLIVILISYYIKQSTFGYGLFAIRENEDTAESIAIPTTRYKMIAFIISAFFPGILGGLYVYHLAYFTSGTVFQVLIALNMIVYTVLGGLGTVAGPIIGSTVLVFIQNVLLSDISEAHVFVTGFFVVIVMILFPYGIIGIIRNIQLDKFLKYFR